MSSCRRRSRPTGERDRDSGRELGRLRAGGLGIFTLVWLLLPLGVCLREVFRRRTAVAAPASSRGGRRLTAGWSPRASCTGSSAWRPTAAAGIACIVCAAVPVRRHAAGAAQRLAGAGSRRPFAGRNLADRAGLLPGRGHLLVGLSRAQADAFLSAPAAGQTDSISLERDLAPRRTSPGGASSPGSMPGFVSASICSSIR